ncbi:MAG: hypothetical protein HUU20_04610 [Pirellulales bacterium]|nr:hypothetical protein [Pirellulales bacterium]
MKLVEMNWNPTARQLRQFGLIALVALPALGWLWGGGLPVVAALTVVGGVMALLGLAYPRSLAPAFVALSLAAIPIGIVVGELALALVYFGLMMPIGLAMRLLGRDGLERKFRPEAATYWQPKKPPQGPESYLRQW